MSENVYMQQPDGFLDPSKPTHVYKLYKSLYDLIKLSVHGTIGCASLSFNGIFPISNGFFRSRMDSALFILHKSSLVIWVFIYVDDIIIIGSDSSAITSCYSA